MSATRTRSPQDPQYELTVEPAAYALEPNAKSLPPAQLPQVKLLYTMVAHCGKGVFTGTGIHGPRIVFPIHGGTFSGPDIEGVVLNIGADWSHGDVFKGEYFVDTRYLLRTLDGAHIYIQTSGAAQPPSPESPETAGGIHLTARFETGDPRYSWLNSVVPFGRLDSLHKGVPDFNAPVSIRVDFFHMTS